MDEGVAAGGPPRQISQKFQSYGSSSKLNRSPLNDKRAEDLKPDARIFQRADDGKPSPVADLDSATKTATVAKNGNGHRFLDGRYVL
jgi:hypothetical protein